MDLGDAVNVDSVDMMPTAPFKSASISSRASSVATSSTIVGHHTPSLLSSSTVAPNPRPPSALSNVTSSAVEVCTTSPNAAEGLTLLLTPVLPDGTPSLVSNDPALVVGIKEGVNATAGEDGEVEKEKDRTDSSGEGEEEEVEVDGGASDGQSMHPVLGYPSMFDLSPSPILDASELPPSRFASLSPVNGPESTQLPAATVSTSTTLQSTSAEIVSARKRKQSLAVDKASTISGEDGEPIPSAKRARKSNLSGAMVTLTTGEAPAGRKDATAKKRSAVRKVSAAQQKAVDGKDADASKELTTSSLSASASSTVDPPWLISAISMLKFEDLGGN